ncbi:MAG: PIN domain-containing protein [Armatimonadota bacterium]|nr:PIN domain-containing protein [Armatimonadota bacterium]MDR7465025.1 PIN domain-containing protein [Armatimonadota bacterium]MDR7470767.1 PIN domain-containing protein [Armatimonadota bacterium]MDR7475322.1 PIN domain-containing protein [Armatimonadota bacterium]MDR7539945.1 PIN domain-containing protein [Armatimonadota bacterium]
MRVVLDSWAVLAWLQGEPPGAVVRDLIDAMAGDGEAHRRARRALRMRLEALQVAISVVNLGEVYYLVGRRAGEREAKAVVAGLRGLGVQVLPVDEPVVLAAASLKVRYPVAYADAFAAAAARSAAGVLVTGDTELARVKEIRIAWIGPGPRP